ncbi:aldehyde dehydrogenase [[Clostridium] polysaccharolyticum]|uniref:4-guanidinobutyraldehyde dehydrogenase / NAD-dependent aldehyde dehydrogenase n=1 Tax=[Clostridium] polysaccharolyticum TaxID=29364 RepID=A0A1I0BE51_9FIRM|nr:aldehyde dehydrogenase [[Clostridium] polysaccharolyticum]SET05064.1 4-guanidinobutyraldehyde dehydrogenase / NAD-dependent aldehyde dehydrogenase [[Clostridium] polysaccharolyticum]
MQIKEGITIYTEAYIDGKYQKSVTGKTFENISPIDGSVITDIAFCQIEDVNLAVKAARRAFEEGVWSGQNPENRKEILYKFADIIEEHIEELAYLETLDMGKPINNSMGEMKRCVKGIRWFGEAIDKVYGDVATTRNSIFATITKEPVGVVAAVIPWNYPLMMAVWKFAPALAAGNSVIVKPAEQSPLTMLRIAEFATQAGIPNGVLQVLPGLGEVTGKVLGEHMDVDKITFTGSAEVGKMMLQYAGNSNMKRVSLECGGKCPNIVFADAKNLDDVAKQTVGAMFYNSGQVCDAPTRLLVDKKIKDDLLKKILMYCKEYQPCNPFDPKCNMGTIVSREQMERVLSYIEIGKKEGAQLLIGGNQVHPVEGGYYIEPTIFVNVKNSMRIAQEEIFGPVLCVLEFDSCQEAIEIANDSSYGLCAFVWTDDLKKAMQLRSKIKCGKVLINSTSDGDWSVPHGGFKQSGFGRDKSLEAMDQYLQTKLTWFEF